ncbi:hypothetical protein BT96DRAFT_937362 [Gymnopus androsaceus JB14]|uniref:Uncharacterized protein n=1 Tax=Gymnopus androsaceus JB14 TaxID=1447944 RepID=A0A6A4HZ48_9AGAR|nr:hypothetical protein BT96DRAFT_937362 [Gymnopus androsaceus JB14]
MSSISQSGEEPVFLLDTETPIQSDPISTRIHATVTAKATSNSPFIAPIEPPSNQQTNTQQTDHFTEVPKLASKGTNFLAFKEQWHIAIATAGYSHLFDTSFIPPTNPKNPEAPGYNVHCRAHNLPKLHLTREPGPSVYVTKPTVVTMKPPVPSNFSLIISLSLVITVGAIPDLCGLPSTPQIPQLGIS